MALKLEFLCLDAESSTLWLCDLGRVNWSQFFLHKMGIITVSLLYTTKIVVNEQFAEST